MGSKKKYAKEINGGDVIRIVLDLSHREISFYKNDVHQGVAFVNIGRGHDI